MLANEPEQSRTPRLDPVCGIELVVQDGRQRRHLHRSAAGKRCW
jgi:hypothetical protein